MSRKSKWDSPQKSSNKKVDAQKTLNGAPANTDKKNKKELEIKKEVNTEIKPEKEIEGNTSNITINNPIVFRYGNKKDVRTALYNVRVRRTPTDTEDNVIGVIKVGEKITILSIENGWAKIDDGKYVMAKYFR